MWAVEPRKAKFWTKLAPDIKIFPPAGSIRTGPRKRCFFVNFLMPLTKLEHLLNFYQHLAKCCRNAAFFSRDGLETFFYEI